jgi:hypothetical protein
VKAGFCAHALLRECHQQFLGFVEIGHPSLLLGGLHTWGKIA